MERERQAAAKSCVGPPRNSKDSLLLAPTTLGQSCPHRCPEHYPQGEGRNESLGNPLSIRDVAALIGVSAWTIRQRYLQAGLPHFRLRPQGKLLFYKNQVVHWLLQRQQKGGQRT